MTQFLAKRAYEIPSPDDGARILVDRLWPRGLAKDNAQLDYWLKDVGPSHDLRKWYHSHPEEFDEFAERYRTELEGKGDDLEQLRTAGDVVTLLTARMEIAHSHLTVLLDLLGVQNLAEPQVETMLTDSPAFGAFSCDDVPAAKEFYGNVLGLDVTEENGMLTLHLGGGRSKLVYSKGDQHVPASFTVINFPVDDVEAAVDELTTRGVIFEKYEGSPMSTDDKGVFRKRGPLIAWFKDPAGNILSVIAPTRLHRGLPSTGS